MTLVLLTGASGFIGRHLSRKLYDFGYDVLCLCRPDSKLALPVLARIDCAAWDEQTLIAQIADRPFDAVIHLAAAGTHPHDRDEDTLTTVNTLLAPALVRIAGQRSAVFVNAGSCAEYAATANALSESDAIEMTEPYGRSKAKGAELAAAEAQTLQVPFRSLRLFHVYGPGEAAHRLLPTLLAAREHNKRIPLSAGTQMRDFIYVDDVCDALLRAMQMLLRGHDPRPRTLNLCTGKATPVRNFALEAARQIGLSKYRLGFGDLTMRDGEKASLVGLPDNIEIDLGWRASYDLESGLKAACKA